MSYDPDDEAVEAGQMRDRGSCGKTCYRTPGAAQRAIKVMKYRGRQRQRDGFLHEYYCKDCRAFHVGHSG